MFSTILLLGKARGVCTASRSARNFISASATVHTGYIEFFIQFLFLCFVVIARGAKHRACAATI